MSRTVLVTDGEQRTALAVVRSLGAAGHRVYVCASRARSLAGASRWAIAEAAVADPLLNAERFTSDVQSLVRSWRVDTLVPIAEPALLALLPRRNDMLDVLLPFPDAATFRRICDKDAILAAAPSVGIAVPAQQVLHQVRDAAGLDDRLRFPVVIKPARSVTEQHGRRTKHDVRHAADPAALAAALREIGDDAFPVLVQERIDGPGVGIFLLVWQGATLATFAHRRIREKPPAGGVSVYRESIAADPALVERSRALLDAFGWCGVAMVEYKVDAASDTPYLMEVNGRFWGSLQLAVDSGVDFPVLLLDAACGAPQPPLTSYRVGVRSRWWWGDVDHLLARLSRSRRALSLPPDAPPRWRALVDFLTIHPGVDREEILRASDPRPFLRETRQWFRRA